MSIRKIVGGDDVGGIGRWLSVIGRCSLVITGVNFKGCVVNQVVGQQTSPTHRTNKRCPPSPPSLSRWIRAFALRRGSPETINAVVRKPASHRDKLSGVDDLRTNGGLEMSVVIQ